MKTYEKDDSGIMIPTTIELFGEEHIENSFVLFFIF
jgi:hypothetical protein